MSKNSKDMLVSLVCIIFSIVFMLIVIPLEIPMPRFDSGGTTPRAIPKICCWVILTMSAIIAVRTFRNDKKCFSVMAKELSAALQSKKGWHTFGYVMIIFALSVVYYIGYSNIGFIITTLVIFPIYAFALGCRKPVTILVTDLLLAFGVYYFFAVGLSCYLPGWAPFAV
ncbi:MAG: tripartite tricarboxylate transporter TctB family protein [Candidatus Heteroscillospira sp.]|jgi:hypothetical protein